MNLRTLVCTTVPGVVYISEAGVIKTNSLRLGLASAKAISVCRELCAEEAAASPATISITCDWEDEARSLCSLEDAKNIVVGNGEWDTKWMRKGWVVTPPPDLDLSGEFECALLFDNIVTSLREGTAVLNIVLHNFPGYQTDAPFTAVVERRYAMSIVLEADREKVEYKEECTISWEVRNSKSCYFCGTRVKAVDSRVVCPVTDPQSYILEAQDDFAELIYAVKQIHLTNWRYAPYAGQGLLPLHEDGCISNTCIYGYGGKFYTFAAGALYGSGSMEAPDFEKLSAPPDAVPADFAFYTTVLVQDSLWVILPDRMYRYVFATGGWTQEKVSLDMGGRVVCHATLFQDAAIYANLYGESMIIFSCYDKVEKTWDTNYFLAVDFKISDFDMLEFHGVLYLAVRKEADTAIKLYKMESLGNFKMLYTAQGRGWLRLLNCKKRLFLLTSDAIEDVNGGALYEDFPDFPATDGVMRLCMTADASYLIFRQGEQEDCYRFRP